MVPGSVRIWARSTRSFATASEARVERVAGIGEIGAAAQKLPAGQALEARHHRIAARQDLGAFARQPVRQVPHPPKRADLAHLRRADRDGVEELSPPPPAAREAMSAPTRWPVSR
jgi:hypothetical protein